MSEIKIQFSSDFQTKTKQKETKEFSSKFNVMNEDDKAYKKPKASKSHKSNNLLLDALFSYSTVRLAKIHNKKIAFLFRFLQLFIIGYVVGYSIIYKKGYQDKDVISSTISTKVKGLGFSKNKSQLVGNSYSNNSSHRLTVFDPIDYVIPATEYNSIFVMTNYIQTKQSRGFCDEDYRNPSANCESDEDCNEDLLTNTWNGVPTGKCVPSTFKPGVKTCEINSWCPVEIDSKENQNVVTNVESYTIFIKNDVKFERFNKNHRNLLANISNAYIKNCTYEPTRDPFCPVFTIKQILSQAEEDPQERERMLTTGGMIRMRINWSCDYDFFSAECLPKYTFNRFDVPYKEKSAGSGFNFRYSDKFQVNDTMYRQLSKVYGLRFVITVTGEAGRFSVLPLLVRLGSGLGLLSLATIITDLFLLNLTGKKKLLYRRLKELNHNNEMCRYIEQRYNP